MPGAYAQFSIAKEDQLALIPDGFSFEQASTIPMAALTAWQVLHVLCSYFLWQWVRDGCSGYQKLHPFQGNSPQRRVVGSSHQPSKWPDFIASFQLFYSLPFVINANDSCS
jgi:hypothetical protein